MDLKDNKILFKLFENSRISNTKLAKEINISREVLNYRIKNLEKNVILKYSSQVNIEVLGFQRTGCYLILQNMLPEFEKKIIEFLMKHDFISGISTNIGIYDIIFDIFHESNKQLVEIIYQIESFIGNKLKDIFFISIPIEPKFFHNKLFNEFKRINKNQIKEIKEVKTSKLDKIDIKILEILNNNSRESLVDIASIVGLQANAVGYRIRNLEKNKVIENSTIFVNFENLGIDLYNIQIKVTKSEHYEKIFKFLNANDNVFYYYYYYGNKDWDIDLGVLVREKKDLKKVIQELKQYFGDLISFKEIYMIDKLYKEGLPKGIFLKD